MGKGGGENITYTSTVSPWNAAANKNLIKNAEWSAYNRPYEVYEGDRIADFSQESLDAHQAGRDLFNRGESAYEGDARSYMDQAMAASGDYRDIQNTYEARDYDFGQFDSDAAKQYMDPYIQNVLEDEMRVARREYKISDREAQDRSIGSGAFGGYRDIMNQVVGTSRRAETMADIENRGMSAAFASAGDLYQADRNARIQAAEMGDLSRYQESTLGMDAANLWNQGLDTRLQTYAGLADTATGLGVTQDEQEMGRIREMDRIGILNQAQQQAYMNLDRQDWENEYNYPRDNMEWLAAMMSGVPQGSKRVDSSPGVDPLIQFMSMGLGGAAIQSLLNSD